MIVLGKQAVHECDEALVRVMASLCVFCQQNSKRQTFYRVLNRPALLCIKQVCHNKSSYVCSDPALLAPSPPPSFPLIPPLVSPSSSSLSSSETAAVPSSDRILSAADAQRRFCETEGYEGHSSNVLRTMGYFSLIGLLRVHCLLGEYETALKALGPIQPFKTGNLLTPKVAGANIALYYYTGFSYLMLQRYLDAARAFNIILNYINRSDSLVD